MNVLSSLYGCFDMVSGDARSESLELHRELFSEGGFFEVFEVFRVKGSKGGGEAGGGGGGAKSKMTYQRDVRTKL